MLDYISACFNKAGCVHLPAKHQGELSVQGQTAVPLNHV